ncbi:hypothetical protein CYLTODRAFT_447440 [Cylindrobasidium torrendii FP15055 ss-10]|uniref:Uncharacterized protein n=1 Tax=Cylindrobasidium torrendii FP15055 ss-10 TaxID=1314674 RepID=A0A0D7AVI1_9AGAR|nr:hypothetical protein CYLTODRAFT_447440 [Cylindrobasidium torrendii FP15055 ss-10]
MSPPCPVSKASSLLATPLLALFSPPPPLLSLSNLQRLFILVGYTQMIAMPHLACKLLTTTGGSAPTPSICHRPRMYSPPTLPGLRITDEQAESPLWWAAILRAATHLDCQSAVDKAAHTISGMKNVDPVLKFNLAVHFRQTQWYLQSFQDIVARVHADPHLPASARNLAIDVAMRRYKYEQSLADNPPGFANSSSSCGTACREAWGELWWDRFFQHVLPSGDPLPHSHTFQWAQGLVDQDIEVPGMCRGCRNAAVRALEPLAPNLDVLIARQEGIRLAQFFQGNVER